MPRALDSIIMNKVCDMPKASHHLLAVSLGAMALFVLPRGEATIRPAVGATESRPNEQRPVAPAPDVAAEQASAPRGAAEQASTSACAALTMPARARKKSAEAIP